MGIANLLDLVASACCTSRPGAPRAADEHIVALEEPKLTLDLAADSDSHAAFDPAYAASRRAEPERSAPAKIDAVVAPVDVQSGGEPPGPARDVDAAFD